MIPKLCQRAVSNLGGELPARIDSDTKNGEICLIHYPLAFESVLRDHAWNWAMKRVILSPEETEGKSERRFRIPADFVRIVSIQPEGIPYRRMGRDILSQAERLTLYYISSTVPDTQADSGFLECLELKLSALIAVPLVDSLQKRDYYEAKYKQKLFNVIAQDANEDYQPRRISMIEPREA